MPAATTDRPYILVVSPHFGRESGGLGASTERITRNLLLHYNIVVLTVRRDLPPFQVTHDHEPGLELIRIGSADRQQLLATISDFTVRLAHEHGCRAMVAFYASDIAYAASLGARIARIPWAVLGRGDDIDAEPFHERGWMTLELIRNAPLVGAVSKEMAGKLAAYGAGDRVRYLPNGVDPVVFAPSDPADPSLRPRIGLFGVIKPKKGLDFLLSTLHGTSHDLVISGALREECAKQLHGVLTLNPALSERVTILPFSRDESELIRRYHAVDVVVLPSTHEGMANVMLEAMSCARVCVCSAVGGAPDVIQDGENGFLFPSGDRERFISSLERAVAASRDPERKVGLAARSHVSTRYTFREERAGFHQFVEELSTGKPFSMRQ